MVGPHIADPRYDVHHTTSVFKTMTVSSHSVAVVQHVELVYYDPLARTSGLDKPASQFLPGEYPASVIGQRVSGRFCMLALETNLGRRIMVGTEHADGVPTSIPAPVGYELRALTLIRDKLGVLSVLPRFSRRARVADDYMGSWGETLDQIRTKATECTELPRQQVDEFIREVRITIHRLDTLDERGIVSPAALAASFDRLLRTARKKVFSRPRTLQLAFFLGPTVQQREATLGRLLGSLRDLNTQLTNQFEATERRFLTDPSLRDGIDVVPFMGQFARQQITPYNCDTALAVFTRHMHMMRRWVYAPRLMQFFIIIGDVARLETVVELQADHLGQNKADVFRAWGDCVPAVRLAIKQRDLRMLRWLLLEVRLSPEDSHPVVPLDSECAERLWTIDQLLQTQPRDSDGEVDMEVLEEIQLLVRRVRNARRFHERTQALIGECTGLAELEQLVPLMTHAFDLRWLFTLVDLYEFQDNHVSLQRLFANALGHMLRERLVLDERSAIFYNKVLREAIRRGFLRDDNVDVLQVRFQRAHMEGALWVQKLQQDVRRAVGELDSTQEQLRRLHQTIRELQRSCAQREQSEQARRHRKLLLSTVSTLLPIVAPAFALLEQCVSLCDPLSFVVAIVDRHATGRADELNVDRFLSGNDPAASLSLQEGLAEELYKINVDAGELVEMLRDVVRDDPFEDQPLHQRSPESRRPSRTRFREIVHIYMQQCQEFEQAVQESVGNSVRPELVARMSMEYPRAQSHADDVPTWRWYSMFTGYFQGARS